ncbi:MAG: sugar ABC transporter permease [Corallococcus sp.]|nr:sugar ABC transporter permease [Corallococcus sp.]MCM1359622.1 sugar ABC transporter permease [Corallococcus sp.]MCM1395214.1 sugar ABC transporter permease [Corallococcus sp.]
MVDGKKQWKAWLYLSPVIILTLVFTVYPIVNTVRMAFSNDYKLMDEIGGMTFSFGVDNFAKVIQYQGFLTCLGNTMFLTVVTVPISTLLALLIAVCLNSIKPLNRLLQTIYFLPYVTNTIAIGLVFSTMFSIVGVGLTTDNPIITTSGIINNIIEAFGGKAVNWVNEGSTWGANMFVMVVYIVWNALPFKILILLGGLQSVNKQYYEAAKVDGTSRARTFWRITVPMLSPMLAYVIITGFIGGFKEYSSIVGVFGDNMGPTGSPGQLNTMVGFINKNIMDSNAHEGKASAAALILFVIIFVVTMLNMYVSKKRVHY